MLTPTMHKSIPMNTRVVIPKGNYYPEDLVGTVVGISSVFVIFYYIVLLDVPIISEYGEQRAISVRGSVLESEDRLSNWKL